MTMRSGSSSIFATAVLVGASLLVQVAHAEADQSKLQKLEQRFKAANKAGDGKLTPQEAKAGMPFVSKHFDKIDKDHKGYVTIADIQAAMAARGK